MSQTILLAIFSATAFSLWPFLITRHNVPGVWGPILINLMTTLVAVTVLIFGTRAYYIPQKALLIGIIGGVINGFGFLVYNKLLASSPGAVSTAVILVTVMVPIVTTLMATLFFGEKITALKILGIIISILGIYLIMK